MDLPVTLALAAAFAAFGAFCGWRGARPPDFKHGRPRMIPWRPLMVGSAAGLLLMLVHAANLVGIHTGR
jgi:H+/Cl- antiporter ClcA